MHKKGQVWLVPFVGTELPQKLTLVHQISPKLPVIYSKVQHNLEEDSNYKFSLSSQLMSQMKKRTKNLAFILFLFCDMCEKPFVLMLILIHHP